MGAGGARVVLIGVGGLGSGSALALARGGVGALRLVDPDRLEPSNLGRQVLYRVADLGRPKAEAAAARLAAGFPGLRVEARVTRLERGNARDLLADADLVVDGLDGFPGRTVLSDAAQDAGIPLVHAGVLRFGGQALTILPGRSTCYRCLMPEPPPPEATPDPAVEGVLGAVVGLFGALEAREALLLLHGEQPVLLDRLWVADLLGDTARLLRVVRDPACPGCGPHRRSWPGAAARPTPRSGPGPSLNAAPAGLPPVSAGPASADRYQRQVRLREVGEPGQRRLADSAITLEGDDAAVWTAALYLVAAGVGTVRLAATEARQTELRGLNPEVTVAGLADGPARPQELRVDPGAPDLLPAELGETSAEMRGAAAAARALLALLGLAPLRQGGQIRR